jgi:lysozyme
MPYPGQRPPSPKRLSGKALAAAAAAACAIAAPLTMRSEGRAPVAYLDTIAKKPTPTTCFGHTGPEVKVGHRYTDHECAVLLDGDMTKEAVGVYQCGPADLADRPKAWAAVTDLAHNIGVRATCQSTAMFWFNAGRWRDGCEAMARFNKSAGKVRRGLVTRRQREVELCLSA